MLKFTERHKFQIFMYNLQDINIYNIYFIYLSLYLSFSLFPSPLSLSLSLLLLHMSSPSSSILDLTFLTQNQDISPSGSSYSYISALEYSYLQPSRKNLLVSKTDCTSLPAQAPQWLCSTCHLTSVCLLLLPNHLTKTGRRTVESFQNFLIMCVCERVYFCVGVYYVCAHMHTPRCMPAKVCL